MITNLCLQAFIYKVLDEDDDENVDDDEDGNDSK